MTNIAFTFPQGHPSEGQSFDYIGQSISKTFPVGAYYKAVSKKLIKTFNKGFLADVFLVITSQVEANPKGGEQ